MQKQLWSRPERFERKRSQLDSLKFTLQHPSINKSAARQPRVKPNQTLHPLIFRFFYPRPYAHSNNVDRPAPLPSASSGPLLPSSGLVPFPAFPSFYTPTLPPPSPPVAFTVPPRPRGTVLPSFTNYSIIYRFARPLSPSPSVFPAASARHS